MAAYNVEYLHLSQIPFDVVFDGLPAVVGAFNGLKAPEKSLFLVVEELDEDVALPVLIEYHLDIHGKGDIPRAEPLTTSLLGCKAVADSFKTKIRTKGKGIIVVAVTKIGRYLAR